MAKIIASSCAFLGAFVISIHAHGANGAPESASKETAETYSVVEATNYCRTLSAPCDLMASGGQCDSTALTGWRLPSADELGAFLGLSTSESYVWTRTPHSPVLGAFVIYSLLDGSWGWGNYDYKTTVRCVR